MSKVERIEQEVAALSSRELESFRAWYSAFDADAWDRQIEQDAVSGRLDALASDALEAHRAGQTKTL